MFMGVKNSLEGEGDSLWEWGVVHVVVVGAIGGLFSG